MKKKVLIIIMSVCSLSYAQVGVNTTDINSTLTVNGSISGNYREVTDASYDIQKDDFNISYSGDIYEGIFTLPTIQKDGDSFGRMYNIKNLSRNKVLVVRTSGNQYLHFGGEYPNNLKDFTIFPGQHLYVIANKRNNWIAYDYSDTYAKKIIKIDANITNNSDVQLGNCTFRIYRSTNSNNNEELYLQMNVHGNRDDAILSQTSFSDFTNYLTSKYSTFIYYKKIKAGKWEYVSVPPSVNNLDRPILVEGRLQMQVSLVTIQTTGETYRVTCTVFQKTTFANASISMKVERLY